MCGGAVHVICRESNITSAVTQGAATASVNPIQLATASSGNPIQLQVGSLRLLCVLWGVLDLIFDHLKTVHSEQAKKPSH
jgi:hypothetical protein